MSVSTTAFQPSAMAQRASTQSIGFLMQQGLENADCLSLAAGFVDSATLPVELAQNAISEIATDSALGKVSLQYGSPLGSDQLRAVFRDYLAELEGPNSKMNQLPLGRIMLTTGSQQFLTLTSQAILNPGDICLVAAPTYFAYLGVLDGVGAEVLPVAADENGMDPAALNATFEQLAAENRLHKVKLVYVVSYHDNPSGVSVSEERRPQLLDCVKRWSKENHIFLLEDAAYREMNYRSEALPSIWSYEEATKNEHVILTQTFSKSFSPGLRVGIGILPSQLIDPVSDIKSNEDFGSAHFNQNVVAHVLKSGQYKTHVSNLHAAYRSKRDAMLAAADEFFSDIPEVTWLKPEGGLYVWMSLPKSISTSFESPLFRQATDVNKVMYVPGQLFYPSSWQQRPDHQMRPSYGVLNAEQIHDGMKRLSEAVKAVL